MTKKHFVALAEALHKEMPTRVGGGNHMQWLDCCMAVADVCEKFSAEFKRDLFIKACREEN